MSYHIVITYNIHDWYAYMLNRKLSELIGQYFKSRLNMAHAL